MNGRFCRRDYCIVAALALVVLLLCCWGIGESELFVNNDETRHAFTGVFVRDLAADFPATSPIRYARDYYEQYPAVAVFRWPPLFYCVEAAFFLILGISVPVAKLSVCSFAVLFAVFFYRMLRDDFDSWTAAGATLLAITAPQFIFYGRAVMLEVPTLALCVAAMFYFRRALRGGGRRERWLCALFTALALLTKQTAFVLLPLFGCYALLGGRGRSLFGRAWLKPLLLLLVLTAPYYAAAMYVYGGTLLRDAGGGGSHLADVHHWLWYYYTLPKQIGSLSGHASLPAQIIAHAALASTLGAAAYSIMRKRREPCLFYLCWIVVSYLFFAPMSQTDSRHMIIWVPPLCLMTALGARAAGTLVSAALGVRGVREVFAGAAVLAVCSFTAYGTMAERPYVRGYEAAARYVADAQDGGAVFFKGYLNGNFIFFLRSSDPARRISVRRACRDLFSTETMSRYRLEEHVASEEELVALLRKHDVRRVVVEEPDIYDDSDGIKSLAILRQALKGGRFRFEKEFPVDSNVPRFRGVVLKAFEFKDED